MTKQKRPWKGLLTGLVLFLLIGAALLAWVPPRSEGMDARFPVWYYIRTAFIALAATLALAGLWSVWKARRTIAASVPDFFRYRPLMLMLVKRDFFVRYRRSILGILWTLLNPLANMIIMTIVFANLFRFEIPHYAAYVLSGNIIFACFQESTNNGLSAIVGNAGMLKKVYVPKYIFPIAKSLVPFLNLLFSFAALLVVMLVTGAPFHVQLVMTPLAVLYLLIFCVGTSLLLSTLFVFFRDIQYLYGIVQTALLYMSAIFYDISIVPVSYMPLFALNPMLHYVRFFRSVTMNGVWPPLSDHIMCLGIGLVALCVGLFVFYKKQDQFILHI